MYARTNWETDRFGKARLRAHTAECGAADCSHARYLALYCYARSGEAGANPNVQKRLSRVVPRLDDHICTPRRVIHGANNGVPSRTDCHRCPFFQFPACRISTACNAPLSTAPLIPEYELNKRYISVIVSLSTSRHQSPIAVPVLPQPPSPPPSLRNRNITRPTPHMCPPQHNSNSPHFLHHCPPASFIYGFGRVKNKNFTSQKIRPHRIFLCIEKKRFRFQF